jgi:adenine-specific DNA methylase
VRTIKENKRLIKDFLPIREISKASKKSIELFRWWARRPLAAYHAAVYASLVPVPVNKNGRGPKREITAEDIEESFGQKQERYST